MIQYVIISFEYWYKKFIPTVHFASPSISGGTREFDFGEDTIEKKQTLLGVLMYRKKKTRNIVGGFL